MPKERCYPPALPHTAIDQLFDDVHLVTGTFPAAGLPNWL
jgi:hypothetical protein